MAEIIEKTFSIKKVNLIVGVTIYTFFACSLFLFEADDLFHRLMYIFFGSVFIISQIWVIFFRPLKITVNSIGISGKTFLGYNKFIEWEDIRKTANYPRFSLVFELFFLLRYRKIKSGTNNKIFLLPLSLKNKTEFNEIMRKMIDDEKVLEKLGVSLINISE